MVRHGLALGRGLGDMVAKAARMTHVPDKSALLNKFLLLATAARDSRLSATALAVLAVILERYNDREGCARPGAGRLAKDTGRTRRNCQYAVEQLVDAGYVTAIRGNRKANRYHPQFHLGMALLGRTSVASDTRLASIPTLPLASPATPEPIEGFHLRNPSMGDRVRGTSESAASAAVPAPLPDLADIWQRLANSGRRNLNMDFLARDCRERYIQRGVPLADLRSALEQLWLHPHWLLLPGPPKVTQARQKPATGAAVTESDFQRMDYSKVPT